MNTVQQNIQLYLQQSINEWDQMKLRIINTDQSKSSKGNSPIKSFVLLMQNDKLTYAELNQLEIVIHVLKPCW